MIEPKDIIVSGKQYTITMLGAKVGRKLWLRFLKVIAPAVREIAARTEVDTKALDDDALVFIAIASAVEHFDEETYELFCNTFIGRTAFHPEGAEKAEPFTEALFDLQFAGDYIGMSKWLGEHLAFNFASFLGGASIAKLLELAKREAASRRQSRKVSTGTSGE